MKLEHRVIPMKCELRAEGEGDKKKMSIAGRAVPYGETSADMGFKEVITAGAFSESISRTIKGEGVIKALWGHDTTQVIGSTENDTLKLSEKKDGVYFTDDLPDTTTGRDAAVLIERGDVNTVSFGFFVIDEKWDDTDKNNVIRYVNKGELVEISPVAFAAYPTTDVSLRSLYDDYKKRSYNPAEDLKRATRERELKLLEVED
jgi:HK97 family phage prohead protease